MNFIVVNNLIFCDLIEMIVAFSFCSNSQLSCLMSRAAIVRRVEEDHASNKFSRCYASNLASTC